MGGFCQLTTPGWEQLLHGDCAQREREHRGILNVFNISMALLNINRMQKMSILQVLNAALGPSNIPIKLILPLSFKSH
jgi:hypothetical protein